MFYSRRQAFIEQLPVNSCAILMAAPEIYRNGDTLYSYRQDSDFFYLTGFPEPDALAVWLPGRQAGEYVLFNRPRDIKAEIWTGERAGQTGALEHYQADESYPISTLHEKMPLLLNGYQRVYFPLGKSSQWDRNLMMWIAKLREQAGKRALIPSEFFQISNIIHEMRLIKQPDEIKLMQQAADISISAHLRAMRACKPGMKEYELEAELSYEMIRQGAMGHGYDPIVAAGKNSCILHYVANQSVIKDTDLVLIDADAEYEYYSADISRTFPANGRFNDYQKAVYEVVYLAQQRVISQIKPGITLDDAQKTTAYELTCGLVELGLLSGKIEDLIKEKAYHRFYMHSVSHWLGMDVHDVGSYRYQGRSKELKPGMVFTVEPGIYISADIPGIDERWHNIGIRIEDDVLVTAQGHEVLTKKLPSAIADIEAVFQ